MSAKAPYNKVYVALTVVWLCSVFVFISTVSISQCFVSSWRVLVWCSDVRKMPILPKVNDNTHNTGHFLSNQI